METIKKIETDKWAFLPLLLLADEQEDMIRRYLDRGTLYALQDAKITKAVCVVTDEGSGILEVKNLAVAPEWPRQGYGRRLLACIENTYRGHYALLQVGTGESPATVPFYQRCGFVFSHRIPNFFLEFYDHPIWEQGVLLKDMVYFKKRI